MTGKLFITPVSSSSTKVTVFCTLSEISIATNSFTLLDQILVISTGTEIKLEISQHSGSFVNYTIIWGDGLKNTFNQSNELNLIPFIASHVYRNEGNFSILIKSENEVQFTNKTLLVQVKNCSFPEINFFYGSKINPVSFFNNIDKEFTATIDENANLCRKENASVDWVLTVGNSDTKIKGVLKNQKVSFVVKKETLKIGSYTLTLIFYYGSISSVSVAYFNIIQAPLIIEIESGDFRTVAYKRKIGTQKFHQNFTITAILRNENPILSQEISFKWRCKLAISLSAALNILNTSEEVISNYNSTTCFNDSWVGLFDFHGSELFFSTEMFFEGVSYKFEVFGIKKVGGDFQSSSFSQEIYFRDAEIPNVKLK